MSSDLHPVIREYIDLVESGTLRVCPEQTALAAYVRRVFATEDLIVDDAQLRHYLSLARYFPFKKLFPWESFLIALWDCTYTAKERLPRWKTSICREAWWTSATRNVSTKALISCTEVPSFSGEARSTPANMPQAACRKH